MLEKIIKKGIILGCGLKTEGIAIIDEIILLPKAVLEMLKKKPTIRMNIANILYSYMLLQSLAGFIQTSEIKSFRLVPMLLLLILTNSSTFKERSFPIHFTLLLMIVNLFFPIIGELNEYEIAWWQNSLWTGTAYFAFAMFILSTIGIQRSDTPSIIKILFPILIYLYSIMNDSRAAIIFCIILLAHFIIINLLNRKINIIVTVILMLSISYYADLLFKNNNAAINPMIHQTLPNNFTSNKFSDEGRRMQNNSIVSLAKDSPINFMIGFGAYSHQTKMQNYGVDPDSDGLIRPTGLPAIIFDYGIIGLLLLLILSIKSAIRLNNYGTNIGESLYLSSLPFISLAYLSVTNLVDMVLFWGVISGTMCSMLKNKLPKQFNS